MYLHPSADTILEYVLPYLMAIAGASSRAMSKVRRFGSHTDADVWTSLWHLFNRTHRDGQLATAVNPGIGSQYSKDSSRGSGYPTALRWNIDLQRHEAKQTGRDCIFDASDI